MPSPQLTPVVGSGSRPRVSIVMPTYKRAHVIGETLATVVSQTFGDMEILVKSDGGDSAAEAVIRGINDPRIIYSQSAGRLKMPGMINSLISEARGHYILVLHDHDLYDPRLVEKMAAVLDAQPRMAYVHTALKAIDSTGAVMATYCGDYAAVTPGDLWLRHMLSRFDCPVCALTMVRRSTYERHGLYNSDFGFISDVEMWMRLAHTGADVGYIAEPLIWCRAREADHEYAKVNWETVDNVLRIHELYESMDRGSRSAPRRVQLLLKNERFRVTQLLAAMKQSRCAKSARSEARNYLLESGQIFSRTLARLIP